MSEAKGDSRVTEVQEWLNETYGAQSWFTKLTVDGMTGAGTCKALCKALQYEIGVKMLMELLEQEHWQYARQLELQ